MTDGEHPERTPEHGGRPSETPDDAARIVAGLDLRTKVSLLSGADHWHLEAVPSAGLRRVAVADGPHGLRRQRTGFTERGPSAPVPATCFPPAVTLASSWDTDLAEEVGVALGVEARAQEVGVLLGPGLNLKRHPAGGRNFEYLSEDPLLAGRLAASMVRGIQSQGVGACCKHLAANHQETFRMVVDTIVDERTLRELELRAFELAVREGRPWTIMTAYNRLNGTYCSDHRWLLTDLLRDTWGFDGLVMTDWGGMGDRVAATEAGCDLEMPGNGGAFDAEVLTAVYEGELPEAAVDRCATRVVELIVRASANRDADVGDHHERHHALARRAAAAGTVLLTNDGTLPLATDQHIALLGAFASTPRYQGAGSSQVAPTRLDDTLTALRARLTGEVGVTYAPAYDPGTGATTEALLSEAVDAARGADLAVIVVGLPGAYESEGFDREHLRLPPGHERLVEAVLDAGVPMVVVLQNGAPVELPWADRPAAIVESYLGGQAGGAALVDVLVGDVEPGGRLAESFPVAMTDLAADANFPGHPKQVEHREGPLIGYRFHDTAGVPARFPFGHGLSYTSFEYGEPEVAGEVSDDGGSLEVRVPVTNTGDRAGSEVVQLYVRDVETSVYRPDKELRAFSKVHLEPGATEQVTLHLDRRAFAVYDVPSRDWIVEAGTFELLLGASSTDLRASTQVEVASARTPTPVPAPASHLADDDEFAAWLGRDVPTPRPVRPFDRSSPLTDLEATPMGRRVGQVIQAAARRQVDRTTPGEDEATRRMFDAVIAQAPLRHLAISGGGKPPLVVLDRMIDVLNGRPQAALTELLRRWRD